MKKYFLLFSILSFLVTVNGVGATTFAFKNYSWFTYRLALDEGTFPDGFFIENNKDFLLIFYGINGTGGYSIQNKSDDSLVSSSSIKNSSSVPVYLFQKKDLNKLSPKVNLFNEITPPEGFIPIAKLMSGEMYHVKSTSGSIYSNTGTEYASTSCKNITEWKACDALILNWYGDSMFPHISKYALSNELPRPSNARTPEQEMFSALIYYGDKPVYIKGTIKYSLNYFPKNKNYYEQIPSYHDPMRPYLLGVLSSLVFAFPLVGIISCFLLFFVLFKIIKRIRKI